MAWIRNEYSATTGLLPLEGSPVDLDPLWRWLKARIDDVGPANVALAVDLPADDPQLADAPPWQDPDNANPFLSNGLLWLLDGLGCYLAELTVAERPNVEWGVYRSANRRDIFQNQTHLFGVEGGGSVDPAGMVYTAVIGYIINDKPWDADGLNNLYRYMTDPDWQPAKS